MIHSLGYLSGVLSLLILMFKPYFTTKATFINLKKTFIVTSLALATGVIGWAVNAQSALSFTLDFVGSTGPGEAAPIGFDPKLFSFEARAGAPGDYEGAIGPNGADAQNTGQYNINWIDGNPVPWSLNWTQDTGTVEFVFAGQTRFYDSGFSGVKFNAFSLLAQSRENGLRVDDNTTITVDLNSINGESIVINGGPSFSQGNSALSFPDNFEHNFYTVNSANIVPEIFSMSGTITLDWDRINPQENRARGLVTVQIKGYDPDFLSPQQPESIPESNSITSLLMLSFLGLGKLVLPNKKNGNQ